MAHKKYGKPAVFSSFIALLAAGVFLYVVNTGCGSSVSPGGAPAPTGIGPAGGTVINDTCKLVIPPGALTKEVNIYVSKYNTSDPAVIPGSSYTIAPSGTIFLIPATINISYESTTPDTVESHYQLGSFNNDQWLGIGDSTVETTLDFVTGETSSLSIYGIVTTGADTIASIEIELTTHSTKMAYGSYYQLGAIAYPDSGVLLDYIWSSTAPSIVSVNALGLMHSVSLGIATINAYAVGKKSADCLVISGNLDVDHIIVRPSAESIYVTGSRQFTAEAKNIDGQTLTGKTFTWDSSNILIASVDANGIAYGVSAEVCLIRASCEGITGTATLTVVDAPTWTLLFPEGTTFGLGSFTSLALDTGNRPHISYYDDYDDNLKYVTGEGATWYPVIVDSSTTEAIGKYSSIALDSNNRPRIAYNANRVSNGDLKYASFEGTSWIFEIVQAGSGGSVGEFTSIKLYNNEPRISYYDAVNKKLRYAWRDPSGWHNQIVDQSFGFPDVGRHSSLAQDLSGNPRISYYDNTNKDLRYASKSGSNWAAPETVDSIGDVGRYTSLAWNNSTGYPSISYYDATNGDLKYAWKDVSGWHKTTVDSSGDVGQFTSLALDVISGYPRISYYDMTNGDLKYAWNDGTAWYTMTVDSTGNVGLYTSLALDSSGRPRISYYDNAFYLRYAEGN